MSREQEPTISRIYAATRLHVNSQTTHSNAVLIFVGKTSSNAEVWLWAVQPAGWRPSVITAVALQESEADLSVHFHSHSLRPLPCPLPSTSFFLRPAKFQSVHSFHLGFSIGFRYFHWKGITLRHVFKTISVNS